MFDLGVFTEVSLFTGLILLALTGGYLAMFASKFAILTRRFGFKSSFITFSLETQTLYIDKFLTLLGVGVLIISIFLFFFNPTYAILIMAYLSACYAVGFFSGLLSSGFMDIQKFVYLIGDEIMEDEGLLFHESDDFIYYMKKGALWHAIKKSNVLKIETIEEKEENLEEG